MPKFSENVGMSHNYTNNSIRATGTTFVTKCMFCLSYIMGGTGHTSVQSLTLYKRTGKEKKIAMGK